jgi:drug/metabolite transporter (DMT)-like permease
VVTPVDLRRLEPMSPIAYGLLTALCWGVADVLARSTGRALGAQGALFGMMATGSLGLAVWTWLGGPPWPGLPSWWTIATALLAAVNMLLFYEAMRRGPVSLVSPAAGAYPAWALLISLGLGVRPPGWALAAMAATIGGVLLVALFAAAQPDPEEAKNRRLTLAIAVFAGMMFGVTLLVGQQAALRDGAIPMLWWGRTTAALMMGALLLLGPKMPRPTLRAAGLTALQGICDTSGLVFLFAAGPGLAGTLATVTSSAFGVVTILLARLLYGERISPGQGVGILLVSGGVTLLAGFA